MLSLFDGIAAGLLALQRAGFKIDKYYSSEIDPYPMAVLKANHPGITHLGSITGWESWDIEQPDIIIGGSACQNLSFAGKQAGLSTKCKKEITTVAQYQALKSEGFEFEGQSHLFWEMMAIRNHYNPNYFFLENVMFAKKWRDIFNRAIGFEADVLNSASVSAQNRKRQYWLGKRGRRGRYLKIRLSAPEDRGILLKDIIENPGVGVIRNRGELQKRNDKSMCLDANYWKGADNHGQRTMIIDFDKAGTCILREFNKDSECHHAADATDINGQDYMKRAYADTGKAPTLNACTGGNREPKVLVPPLAFTERRTEEAKKIRREHRRRTGKDYSPRRAKELVSRTDGKMNCLTAAYSEKEHNILDTQYAYRKLTPVECCRLQTFPDDYFIKSGLSNSRIYKALGNSWTVDMIAHIFNHIKGVHNDY